MVRCSSFSRAVVVSSLSLGALLVGCGGDDIPGSDFPDQDSGFNDATTERPDDGVDSTKPDGGTDGGTDGGSDGGTDTLVAEGGTDTSPAEGGTDAADGGETGTFAAEVTVGAGVGTTYSPSTASIKVGDTVRWTWTGIASHSVTSGTVTGVTVSPDGKFASGVHAAPFTFTHKFDTAGTFPYYCEVHGLGGMTGKIIVTP